MSYLSVNSLFNYGRQAYLTCTSFRDKTLESCQQIARRVWDERVMPLAYRIAPQKLFNIMFRLRVGLSIEESKNKELHLAAYWGTTQDIDAILAKGADANVKNWIGMTPLHYTALKGNSEGCRSLLNKKADIETKSPRGRTPLHYAAMGGHVDIIRDLLAAGATHSVKTAQGNTPLHLAVLNNNKEATRALVAAGADIYATNSDNILPLTCNNFEFYRIMLGVESHPAFESITTLQDYCDRTFPASRDRLPKDWETWLKKLKREKDSFQELRKVLEKCEQKHLKTIENIQTISSCPPTIETIVQGLIQESPLFAKAWALVNRDEKLKLIEMSTPHCLLGPAFYLSPSHAIHIHKSLNIYMKTFCVIFEVMNALQREHIHRIHQLARFGELSREEFTFSIEALEYETSWWTLKILGKSLDINLTEYWKIENIPVAPSKHLPEGGPPHTDIYRELWELLYAAPYLKKHPELDIALRKSCNSNQKTSRH